MGGGGGGDEAAGRGESRKRKRKGRGFMNCISTYTTTKPPSGGRPALCKLKNFFLIAKC